MTNSTADIISHYERGSVQVDPRWLKRFESQFQTRNPIILEYLNRRDIRIATKADLEYLYSQMPISQIALLYKAAWETVKKRMDAMGIEKRKTRRDYRVKWWEIQEGEDVYPISNLKQFAITYDLNYSQIHYRIIHKGEYQDERFTIRRYTPDGDVR
jgi:hypothetical protein